MTAEIRGGGSLPRQQCLYFFPDPQGQGAFLPMAIMGSSLL
jgi:hypothetical protein